MSDVRMANSKTSPLVISDEEFNSVRELVYNHCGIRLNDGKQDLVRSRVANRLRSGSFPSLTAYLDYVRNDTSGHEFAELIDAISTNLTCFFRESHHFDYLRDRFLPDLLDRKRKEGVHRIRAWSAACSTGEEPYSLAMLLYETVVVQGGWDVKILATDVSGRVLRFAREGVYKETQLTGLSTDMRAKYCLPDRRQSGDAFYLSPTIRELVQFKYLNLIRPFPFTGPLDFIFCRNVMIYFDERTQQSLVNRFYGCLREGGVLFTGHSESLSGLEHKFQYVEPTIYVKGELTTTQRSAA